MAKALLVIDMQKFVEMRINSGIGFYPSNAIVNMQHILNAYRKNHEKIIFIKHQPSTDSDPQQLEMMGNFQNQSSEIVLTKNTSSAFASTELKQYLDKHAITELTVIGAVAGFCVNSTVRHGGDLGIKMTVIGNAVISFDLPNTDLKTKDIHDVTIGLLQAGFANIALSCDY